MFMNLAKLHIKNKTIQHIIFWIVLFCVYVLSYSGKSENFIYFAKNNATKFPFYMLTAYTFNYWLVPKFLNKKKYVFFIIALTITSIV